MDIYHAIDEIEDVAFLYFIYISKTTETFNKYQLKCLGERNVPIYKHFESFWNAVWNYKFKQQQN